MKIEGDDAYEVPSTMPGVQNTLGKQEPSQKHSGTKPTQCFVHSKCSKILGSLTVLVDSE